MVPSKITSIDDLPNEIIIDIFQYLKAIDLARVQFVSDRWYLLAQSSVLWRDLVFRTTQYMDTEIVQAYLQVMPKLRHFVCGSDHLDPDGIVDALVNNCEDIKSVDCSTGLQLSPKHIRKLVKRFPTLESFAMETYVPAFLLDTLQTLASCGHLKEAFFTFLGYDGSYSQKELAKILGNGFPSLQTLNLTQLQNALSGRGLAYVLWKKARQLKSLTLECYVGTHPAILVQLANCVNLTSLDISIASPKTPLILYTLTELRSLKVCIENYGGYDIFNNIVAKGAWPKLEELSLATKYRSSRRKLLSEVFFKLPHIKTLKLYDVEVDTINMQLTWIVNVASLQHLKLVGYRNLTERGLKHVAQCPDLQYLQLSHCVALTDKSLEVLKSYRSLRTLVLSECLITGSTLVSLVDSLENLTELTVRKCPNFDKSLIEVLSLKVNKFIHIDVASMSEIEWRFLHCFRIDPFKI